VLTRQVNAAIKKDVVAEHVAYVDIYTPFKGKDGALAAAGYSPLD
jgi:hypothetical protein